MSSVSSQTVAETSRQSGLQDVNCSVDATLAEKIA